MKKHLGLSRAILLIMSVVMISGGLMREEQHTLFKKAVNICLECIGIG